jgi:apolipoprotein N-acyltransferase
MAPSNSATPLKRHWGWGLSCSLVALTAIGMGVGDFFVKKATPGCVLLAMGAVFGALGFVAFRSRFAPPPPLPPLGWKRYAAALSAGVLVGLAFPICFPIFSHEEQIRSGVLEVLAWIGMVPLYFALDGQTPRRSLWLGFLAGMAFFNTTFWWVNVAMTTFGGIPNFLSVPVLQLLVAWCALHWGLAGWASSHLQRRFGWPLWITLPVAWCATELMRNYFMSGYPWTNLGYATSRDLAFAQVASLGGVYLIAFCLVLTNGVVFTLVQSVRNKAPLPRTALGIGALVVIGGHLYGALRLPRLESEIASAPKVKVGLIQGNIDQKIKSRHETYRNFILDQYVPQTDAADDEGAELIIWPEAAFPGYFDSDRLASQPLKMRGFDREQYRSQMMFGVQTHSRLTNGSSNSAFWVDRDLVVQAQYDKHHLVPFGEYVLWNLDRYLPIGALVQDVGFFAPGKDLPIWRVPLADGRQVNVGMLICYDAIFPEIVRDYAQRDTDLLVNITNDAWYGFSSAPYQFLRMVQMRAIESGRSVARAANTGITAVIDPAGHILAQTGLGLVNSADDEVDAAMHIPATRLVQDVPVLRKYTIYTSIGDLFAYLCSALSVVGVALSMFARRAQAATGAQVSVDKEAEAVRQGVS